LRQKRKEEHNLLKKLQNKEKDENHRQNKLQLKESMKSTYSSGPDSDEKKSSSDDEINQKIMKNVEERMSSQKFGEKKNFK
jgi:hypothetical protein